MLNVMEERDIQIRGYVLRLPLDVLVVASANPEDYTNRGRIITPLKDRFGAEIRTHYPVELEDEVAVIRQEAHLVADVPGPPGRDPGPVHPRAARVQRRRPALGRLGPVLDRRRGDDRGRRAAPGHEPGRARGGRPGRRPRDARSRCSAARSSSRPARRVASARSSSTCSARRPPRPSASPPWDRLRAARRRASRAAPRSPPASRSAPSTYCRAARPGRVRAVRRGLRPARSPQRRRARQRGRARARGALPGPQDRQGAPAAGRRSYG